ncbi:hypothetical protein Bca52824_022469 [Brassica carinata]|uniref:Uncharacterized protein n=1 Tax=Brassica carinata TaxID=52824 RepID=A0A8X8AT71_BRACI|nr:hypothetical protein Bca52824_022469 [Brassica carinata]
MTKRKSGGKKNTKRKKGKSTKRNIAPVEEQHVEELSTGNDSDDLSSHGNETDLPIHENETDHMSETSQKIVIVEEAEGQKAQETDKEEENEEAEEEKQPEAEEEKDSEKEAQKEDKGSVEEKEQEIEAENREGWILTVCKTDDVPAVEKDDGETSRISACGGIKHRPKVMAVRKHAPKKRVGRES